MQHQDCRIGKPENKQFKSLVLMFLNYCRSPRKLCGAYWIMKLTLVRANQTTYAVFAATRSHSGIHVEVIFIKWWEQFQALLEIGGDKIASVRVYTNFTPCYKCAPKLKEWLELNPTVELSLHYAFVYIKLKEADVEKHLEGLRSLRDARNLAQINKISMDLLTRLSEEVRVGQPGSVYKVSPYIRGIDNEYLEARINYQRALGLTDKGEESCETHMQTPIGERPCVNDVTMNSTFFDPLTPPATPSPKARTPPPWM